jgi:hypothetical protein
MDHTGCHQLVFWLQNNVVRSANRTARASVPFHALYGAAFVVYLHGARTLWIAALGLVHFGVCKALAGVPRLGPIAAWASGCGQGWIRVPLFTTSFCTVKTRFH